MENRIESKQKVIADSVPTVDLTNYKSTLNETIIDNVVFRKDVVNTFTVTNGNCTVDYINTDTAIINATTNVSISFTNLVNGDERFLIVNKNTGNKITFASAADLTEQIENEEQLSTKTRYKVYCKNNDVFVKAIRQLYLATSNDMTSGNFFAIPRCNVIKSFVENYVAGVRKTITPVVGVTIQHPDLIFYPFMNSYNIDLIFTRTNGVMVEKIGKIEDYYNYEDIWLPMTYPGILKIEMSGDIYVLGVSNVLSFSIHGRFWNYTS